MHKLIGVSIAVILFIYPLLGMGETITADVTGDGVDDEIKIGEQSVVVEDGQSSKKYIVISGEEMLNGASVNDYSVKRKGKEIAIEIVTGPESFTEIYAFKNSKFFNISGRLPGEVIVTDDGELVGHTRYFFEAGGWIPLPWPLQEVGDSIVALVSKKETEKTISVDANSSKDILIECTKNSDIVIGAVVADKDVILGVYDGAGNEDMRTTIDAENPFIFYDFGTKKETKTLTIDNSYSIMTPKTVTYVIIQY